MATFCCTDNRDCVGPSAVASIVLGIVAAFLRITGVITVTPAFLWVTFGVSVGLLAVFLASSGCCIRTSACGCGGTALTAALAGILLSILVSVVLLAITFVTTSVIGAILVGLLILGFSLALTATACLIRCLATRN